MITDYPILRYLSTKTGRYLCGDSGYEIELRKNHYDFVILSSTSKKGSGFYGVIGVLGEDLELHASVGMPNIIVLSWPQPLNRIDGNISIEFKDKSMGSGIEISLSFVEDSLNIKFIVNGKISKSYDLSKA